MASLKEIIENKPVMKMQGTGNDFILIFDYQGKATSAQAKKLCDRHFGVGADGLITVMKPRIEQAEYRMKIFNADGSSAEMCGNGIRCFVKYLADIGRIPPEGTVSVDTDAGLIQPEILEYTQEEALVKVNMGKPLLHDSKQVSLHPAKDGVVRGQVSDLDFTFISMGNPHAVIFCDEPQSLVKQYGPLIECDLKVFPQKTNVEFVKLNNRHDLHMFVWERGVGETLACGTGACASFVAAVLNGYCSDRATVHLLGGDLDIAWHGGPNRDMPVYLTGYCRNVFEIKSDSVLF